MERKKKLLIGATVLGGIAAAVAFWPDEANAASAPGPKPAPKPKPVAPKAETAEQKAAKAAALEAAQAADWQAAVVAAVRSGDAAALEAVAKKMEAAGKTAEAASLRALVASWTVDADSVNKAQEVAHGVLTKGDSVKPPVGLPTKSTPTPAPAKPPAIVSAPVPDAAKLARTKRTADLMTHLRGVARYKEDRTQVKLWQQAEGRTMDGMYGPGDATHVINTFDIIPAVPFYWSKKGGKVAEKQKQDFTALLNAKAKAQPERAALWLALVPAVRKS